MGIHLPQAAAEDVAGTAYEFTNINHVSDDEVHWFSAFYGNIMDFKDADIF